MAPRKRARPSAAATAAASGTLVSVTSDEVASARFYNALVDMWRSGTLCDCEVQAEGRTFQAHRVVLSAWSDFMRSAFCSGMTEAATATVSLEEVEASVLEAVLEFCYTGAATFDEGLAVAVLKAAARLQIQPLQDVVLAHVITSVGPANCLSAWALGDALTLQPLVAAAEAAAKKAFKELAAGEDLLSVPAAWLEGLLGSDDLEVDDEEIIYDALKRWHAAQQPAPTPEALCRLLELVRWPLLSHATMQERVNIDPMVTGHGACAMVMAASFQAAAFGARPRPRAGTDTIFRFESAFDTNGILYHLGTAGGTRPYRNPHLSKDVVVSMSSHVHRYGSVENVVQHQHASPLHVFTSNSERSWMAVDLGEVSLTVDHYCLRSDSHNGHQYHHKLRRWQLEGSNDGTEWQVLKQHTDDASLGLESMSTAAWPVDAGNRAFRRFRILQTGPSSSGYHHLMCAGIELYGRAKLNRRRQIA